MASFPSADWFNTVREIFNADDSYRGGGGGTCNAVVGFKVGDRAFLTTFEGFECTDAQEVDGGALDAADFFLDMPAERWQAMIENIKANGHADLHYTLNTLDLDIEDGIAHSTHNDQYREDLFFRYNQTFQYFFDASARINTRFE